MAKESLTAHIERLGFKRWYERQLLSSHAHLVLCLLCLLGLMGGFEAFSRAAQGMADKLVDVLAILLSAGIGVWSLRQYLRRISIAEFVANQANCPQCGKYARWQCLPPPTDGGVDAKCRNCQHSWHIEPP